MSKESKGMSRLAEIIDNHEHLDQLFSLMKHYGVNAEFIAAAVIEQFQNGEEKGAEGEENKTEQNDLVNDLKQFCARL
jgi:hypothetical protein